MLSLREKFRRACYGYVDVVTHKTAAENNKMAKGPGLGNNSLNAAPMMPRKKRDSMKLRTTAKIRR